ncbi:hypothetical protein GR205_27580 [Rhizobium leguminosarum]|uniref:carbamoyltransferase family protein n=1 Tax=Rhizobium ruizarguesonis TaxID=2081791 RepID=UPI0013DF4E7B|nr:carbamoyltransferase C-terminal domain-containing protein [Rhizobium ruizarguesonis]NEJ31740.1 hypothetical protein [Rhizobium ruizarguesonis]
MSKTFILGLNPGVAGLNYHDPAAIFTSGDRVVFASEEERHCRVKHAPGVFPLTSVAAGLATLGIQADDIASIAVGHDPGLWVKRFQVSSRQSESTSEPRSDEKWKRLASVDRLRATAAVVEGLGRHYAGQPVLFYPHHEAHAASAYYCSAFSEATILVCDGVGELSSTSLWHGRNGELSLLLEYPVWESLGYFFAIVTSMLGFSPWSDEGKVMGLAPYGRFDHELEERCNRELLRDGRLNLTEIISSSLRNGYELDFAQAKLLMAASTGICPREAGQGLRSVDQAFAFWAQATLEREVLQIAEDGIKLTGCANLAVAGGVHLNCKLNGRLRELPEVAAFFAQPVSGDAGSALGAALLARGTKIHVSYESLALGTPIPIDQVEKLLEGAPIIKREFCPRQLAMEVADGAIVCWVQGRSEFGPRALGHRSILADPRSPSISDRVNEVVKRREQWRPFCPSVLAERGQDLFFSKHGPVVSPYMIESFQVRPAWRQLLAGVVHRCDGSARPHTVTRQNNPRLHDLISCFSDITKVPALLNTSMNTKDEPIVETAYDVVEFFLKSPHVPVLVVDDAVFIKVT